MGFKVCFVLPEYNIATPTHFNYIYEFLDVLKKDFDIFLIVERGNAPAFFQNKNYYAQRFHFLPLRAIENLLIVLYARLKGYRDFYIHYSFLSAFNSSLIVKLFGGRTFYWNCGLPWLYKRNFFRDFFEKFVYKFVTFLVTGTENLKKQYNFYYHLSLEKIKIMPNLIDCRRFSSTFSFRNEIRKYLNIPIEFKVILFAHRLSKRKGAHYLPEILKRLVDENVVLLIVGDGPEREALNLQLTTYNLQQKVRMLGWVPNTKIQKYFGMADVFILPSEEEGFPHVALEAMASSLPVVAFDVGGVKDIMPPEFSEYIIAVGDIKSFSNKIKEIFKLSPDELRKLKNIELNWIKNFDMKLAVEKFKNLLYHNFYGK